MIEISKILDNYFLWDVDQISVIREQHRIIGSFIGNNNEVPLRLMREEVDVLINEVRAAVIVDKTEDVGRPHSDSQIQGDFLFI